MPPIVAIVGRPNVGKSTLFNRLTRGRRAITHDLPGVTRDRLEAPAEIEGRFVTLVDTGGMDYEAEESLARQIVEQAEAALVTADVVLFLVDGKAGRTALEDDLAERLRRLGKPVIVAVNKVDGLERVAAMTADFHAWGLPLLAISAAHGQGMAELAEAIAERLPEAEPYDPDAPLVQTVLRLAVLGRPNAGKSSLINALVGESRLIVSDIAGTTRDAVDVVVHQKGKRYLFVDTAGVRKRTRITDGLERYSVAKALSSAKRADVAVVVIDATGGVGVQDKRLISFLDSERKAFLVAVNKTDLVPQKDMLALQKDIARELRMCSHVPVLYMSAAKGKGVAKVLPQAEAIWAECQIRIGTGELNRAMRASLDKHQPPLVNGRRAKFYYLTQAADAPPTFVFFVSDTERVRDSYIKYLENSLRKLFGIATAPVKVVCRASHKPKDER
ncbi:ribosome biogenesis GTPase Der [Solidesulfovibrio magneticus]|uniref:GTPase Der n=1 Tax=Solidesulfovibrio magneticus (strain ATCC 700980 / DSM 13731 / RS-1) TaxID=573370 RepID=DER_SOLM1|nr:ribosome biogenesis GTPase Der [Solidesulfovibrio magneticus]C4XIQ6.1 RecName: Full=GTPase Der; AltName: Full=GTP-binding protein EngA [Solidesulfovibrio magneticus RS-1]BAH76624.1 GTP-binding protein EngA [Solidesulfovibrio magneticus RS-1]